MNVTRRPLLADTVRDQLRQAIESGEYPPSSKLPNELLLGDRFKVSRATVREAVRGLVEEARKAIEGDALISQELTPDFKWTDAAPWCPLYPRKSTFAAYLAMSAKGRKRTIERLWSKLGSATKVAWVAK